MKRIKSIDAIRGLCIVLMIAYHFGYDLVTFLGAPEGLIFNPLLDVLQPLFAGVFIFISGVSCRFSRSNARRGIQMLVCGLAVTMVSALIGSPAWFGILSFLGVSALLFAAYDRLFGRYTPSDGVRVALIVLFGILYVITRLLLYERYFDIPYLWWLGIVRQDFWSADHFPLLPWIFVYAAGVVAGRWVSERRLPERFYTADIRPLSFVGRNTLAVYVLHQPVLYAVVMVIAAIMRV